MSDLELETPAQQRLARGLLAWSGPRPPAPDDLAERLTGRLETGLERVGAWPVAAGRSGALTIGRRVLTRRVCDGWQLDPVPFEHRWGSVRSALTREAVAAELEQGRGDPVGLVERIWREAASRRPGDPSSLSAWLNQRSPAEAERLRSDVAELVAGFQEVWPVLPDGAVVLRARRAIETVHARGRLRLFGVPDIVLDSPRRDGRSRALVVDLRTARPQPDRQLEELRFHALLVTLTTGLPPFRWGILHLLEGRSEWEDLDPSVLVGVVDQVLESVEQRLRLASATSTDPAERLRAGWWCADCRRRDGCQVAIAAGVGQDVDRSVSQA